MPKRLDLVGQTFGRLTVVDFDHISEDGNSYWLCECSCKDKTRIVSKGHDLRQGKVRSCGCLRRDTNDITGRVFGRLKVIGLDHVSEKGRTYWLCECCCNNNTKVVVRRDGLISGAVLSCGCLHSEELSKRLTKHGMSSSRIYKIWSGMHNRCKNNSDSSYSSYGGRGITVCNEWYAFENFRDWSIAHGYSDNLSIDRINNDLGYSPDNCRWTDRTTQQNNRRINRHITYGGETKTLAEWVKCLHVKYSTLWYRIDRGDFSDFEQYFENKGHEDG